MTILYTVGDKLYVNMTNRCPCRCTFCIRNNGDGAYGSDSLWLEREPSVDEIKAEFEKYDLAKFTEIVFCGYGEPMERADELADIAAFVKGYSDIKIRLNTNGLGDKIHGRPTARLLEGKIDIVSISLNSCDREKYNAVTRPKWDDAFEAMLSFASDCKKYVPKVMFTVVDVISQDEIDGSRTLAEKLGIELRVRKYDS
ncbi:MAG: TIGR04100 family radical SAM protein [Oscillospiraceae bacterium]|nr:TIGR04100 family radical SAM protein [Oscillospiraceae bacterium]